MAELDFLEALAKTNAALPPPVRPARTTETELDRAVQLAMQHIGVVGAGLGLGGKLKVFVSDSQYLSQLPGEIGGFRTSVEVTGPINAL